MPETEIDIEKRNKYGMLCGIVGIFLNLILFAGKLFAGMHMEYSAVSSGSVST